MGRAGDPRFGGGGRGASRKVPLLLAAMIFAAIGRTIPRSEAGLAPTKSAGAGGVPPGGATPLVQARGVLRRQMAARGATGKGPEWPEVMIGESVRGPYVRSSNLKVAESCRGLLPAHPANPLLGGAPVSQSAANKAFQLTEEYNNLRRRGQGPANVDRRMRSSAEIANLSRAGELRALLYVVEGGMGNNLMGSTLGLSYAFLSGRRFLRYEFGRFRSGIQAICGGFECGVARMPDVGNVSRVASCLSLLPDFQLWASLGDPAPLMLFNNHGMAGNLSRDPRLQRCLLDSLGCADHWCSRSQELHRFLGAPTPALASAVERSMTVLGPSTQRLESLGGHVAPLQARQLLRQRFAALLDEVSTVYRRGPSGAAAGMSGTPRGRNVVAGVVGEPASDEGVALTSMGLGPSGLPLDPNGSTSPSATKLSATTALFESRSGRNGASSASPLRLEFDVAIHIRTLSPCVEHNPFRAGCRSSSMAQTLERVNGSKKFQEFVKARDWICVSSLLAFLHKIKFGGLESSDSTERREQERAAMNFPPGSRSRELLAAFLNKVSPGEAQGLWTVGDAQEFALGALPLVSGDSTEETGGSNETEGRARGSERGLPTGSNETLGNSTPMGRLRIFLATDNEAMRPLFVELVRPFGTVVSSKAAIAHTGTSPKLAPRKHGESALLSAKLESLAEFFLLSKAAVAVNFGARRSSFVEQAAIFGNSTLILRGKHHRMHPRRGSCSCPCCYSVEHWAEKV